MPSYLLYRLLIALLGLVTVIVLLVTTVVLARCGQPAAAILTGTSAGCLAIGGMFRLLTELGRP